MRRSVIFLFLYLSLSPFEYPPYLVEEGQTGLDLPTYPCASLSLNQQGLTCQISDPYWETTLFLPFPRLYILEENVDELRALPVSSVSQRVHTLTVHNDNQIEPLELQQVQITLFLTPAIPNTLLPYLEDQWGSWGKNRIPYVGQWEVSYLLRVGEKWLPQHFAGEIGPVDIENLPDELAADINYNGLPTAFWNYQVNQP